MQNMDDYYDFSGQKFGYPLSLSMNGFDRNVFSRQTSLELSYVLKGEYEAVTEHFSCLVKEHELLIVAPGEIHMIRKNSERESVILTIHIDFSRFSKPMAGEAEGVFQTILCSKEQNFKLLMKLKQKIGELMGLLQRNEFPLFQMNAIMAELVSIASDQSRYAIGCLPLQSEHHENYMKAILYLDSHYKEELRLGDLAEALSFSSSYTSRLFRKFTGMTFVRYLTAVRVRASLEELLEGKETIEKIAFDCGMPNSKAYTTAFKELYGITPNLYRNKFKCNLIAAGDMSGQQMTVTDRQRELLEHLAEEAGEVLYENASVKVTNRDGQIRCVIQTDEKVKSVITQEDQQLVIEISRKEQ